MSLLWNSMSGSYDLQFLVIIVIVHLEQSLLADILDSFNFFLSWDSVRKKTHSNSEQH